MSLSELKQAITAAQVSTASVSKHTEEVLGAVFAAVVYCALSSCLGVYAWLIWRQAQDSRANKVSFRTGFVKKDQKASGIVPVLGVAALIFGGRTIYVTLLAAGVASPCAPPSTSRAPQSARGQTGASSRSRAAR